MINAFIKTAPKHQYLTQKYGKLLPKHEFCFQKIPESALSIKQLHFLGAESKKNRATYAYTPFYYFAQILIISFKHPRTCMHIHAFIQLICIYMYKCMNNKYLYGSIFGSNLKALVKQLYLMYYKALILIY